MFDLTRQEKTFLWVLSLVILTGTIINYVFKKLPGLATRARLVDAVASPVKVDINTASLEELLTIPYVGPKRAQDILDYRAAKGLFKSIEDLKEIYGIGPKTYLRMAPFVKAAQPRGT